MDSTYSDQFAYREQLLRISEQMTAQDIEKLLWLLKKVIPLAKAEKIRKGYQLFDELEKQRLLTPHDLSVLGKCLSAIGRHDLSLLTTAAKQKATSTSRILAVRAPLSFKTITPVSGTPPQCIKHFSYRKELLHISDCLRPEDIEALIWLLTNVIPHGRAEEITEGYQLFDELEKCGYLGPTSLSFLRIHLLAANREDLAYELDTKLETATSASLPYIPSTFTANQYTHIFKMKTTECVSKMNSLARIGSTQAGEERGKLHEMIYSAAHEIWYAAELDIPEKWWQPTATPEIIDEVIRNTLQSTLAFTKNIFPCYSDPIPVNWDTLWQSCCQTYQTFDKELDKPHVKWNTCIRNKIREKIDSRMHPHGILASCVCDYTQSICMDLFQDRTFQTELKRVSDNLFTWESAWYMRWQNAALFHWISNLLHLAYSSVIDLRRHRELILKLFAEHKHNIHQSLADISRIVGKDILQKLSPVLELLECRPECSSQNPSQEFTLPCIPVLWYVLLMELVAFAEGYHINPREIGKATVDHLVSYSSGIIITSNMKVLQTAANRMHTDVLNLWNYAAKVADSSHYGVPVQELFPNIDS